MIVLNVSAFNSTCGGTRVAGCSDSTACRSVRGLGLMKVAEDSFGRFSRHHGAQRFGGGLLDVAEAAEVAEQALPRLRSHAGDVQ